MIAEQKLNELTDATQGEIAILKGTKITLIAVKPLIVTPKRFEDQKI